MVWRGGSDIAIHSPHLGCSRQGGGGLCEGPKVCGGVLCLGCCRGVGPNQRPLHVRGDGVRDNLTIHRPRLVLQEMRSGGHRRSRSAHLREHCGGRSS